MAISRDQVLNALRNVKDPELGRDLVSLNMIRDVAISGDHARIAVELTTPACPLKDQIQNDIRAELARLGISRIDIDWSAQVRATPKSAHQLPGVRNIVAIGAGKGGVGKSTIAVLGAKVGLLDADIYGPSIPKMLGIENEKPRVRDDKIVPIAAHGIRVISMGFMVEPERAVIWRGPMVHGVIKQFLDQVDWGDLDYLIIDLPPGTGDVPLTLSQSIPLTGAVVVCTPQAVALLDAVKALRMYQQLNVSILGIVENMSYFIAPDTGREYDLFGRGGAKEAASRLDVPFLGEIPININIRVSGDSGRPEINFDAAQPDVTRAGEPGKAGPACAAAIMHFVRTLAGRISVQNMQPSQTVELKIT